MNKIEEILTLIRDRYRCDEFVARTIMGGHLARPHSYVDGMNKRNRFAPSTMEKLDRIEQFFREEEDYILRCPYVPASEELEREAVKAAGRLARLIEYYENCIPIKNGMAKLRRRFITRDGKLYLKDGPTSPYVKVGKDFVKLSPKVFELIHLAEEIRQAKSKGKFDSRSKKSRLAYTEKTGRPSSLTSAQQQKFAKLGLPKPEDIVYLHDKQEFENNKDEVKLYKHSSGRWARSKITRVVPIVTSRWKDETYPPVQRIIDLLTFEQNWFDDYKVVWQDKEFSGLQAMGVNKAAVRIVLPVRIQSIKDNDIVIYSDTCPVESTPLMASYAAWLYSTMGYPKPNKMLTNLCPDKDMLEGITEELVKAGDIMQKKFDKAKALGDKFKRRKKS